MQCWRVFANIEPPLPPGFTCSVELEGVDGKSGHHGSGRRGPIAVDDGEPFIRPLLSHRLIIALAQRFSRSPFWPSTMLS